MTRIKATFRASVIVDVDENDAVALDDGEISDDLYVAVIESLPSQVDVDEIDHAERA